MFKHEWSFVIVGGGCGSRIGGMPKQFRMLGGIPVWKWSFAVAQQLLAAGLVKDIVLVMPDNRINDLTAEISDPMVKITAGGALRSESVMNGLKLCSGSHVLIHDAARPFLSPDLCCRLMAEAGGTGAAVPLLSSQDSLKKADDAGQISCVDRKNIYRTQTPQAFDKMELIEAVKDFGNSGTDEAEAWIASGRKISSVEGDPADFKITTLFDLVAAEALANAAIERRVGHGYDVHKLVDGRKLILAGIEIKGALLGLLGHSDADIVTHTVMDAILGAAGEPDIGTLFPASDDKWKDASSVMMLEQVIKLVRGKGWRIDWVDITLTAQTPKLGGFISRFVDEMSKYLADGSSRERSFNMKVKSGEECGSVGRSECMVCHGVALLSRISPNFYTNIEKYKWR